MKSKSDGARAARSRPRRVAVGEMSIFVGEDGLKRAQRHAVERRGPQEKTALAAAALENGDCVPGVM